MVETVASIRSAILHEASANRPTPLERAVAAAQPAGGQFSAKLLTASAAVQTQIIVSRLDGDILNASLNSAQIQAAYDASVALIRDANARSGSVDFLA